MGLPPKYVSLTMSALSNAFERASPFTPKSGLRCPSLTAVRRPRPARDLSVDFSPTHTSLEA